MHQCASPPLLHICWCSISWWDSQKCSPIPHSLASTSPSTPCSSFSPSQRVFERAPLWPLCCSCCCAPGAVVLLPWLRLAMARAWPPLSLPAASPGGRSPSLSLLLRSRLSSLCCLLEEQKGSRVQGFRCEPRTSGRWLDSSKVQGSRCKICFPFLLF